MTHVKMLAAHNEHEKEDGYQDNEDYLIVVDIKSGELLDRVKTGSHLANGMFLTPGGNRDIFYCSTFTVARVQWR